MCQPSLVSTSDPSLPAPSLESQAELRQGSLQTSLQRPWQKLYSQAFLVTTELESPHPSNQNSTLDNQRIDLSIFSNLI